MNSGFIESYFCFSVASTEKSHLEDGNRIVMPESSLQRLINRDVDFPYYFRITKYICHDNNNDHTRREDEWNFSDHSSDYSFQSTGDSESSPETDPDQKQSYDDEEEEEEEDSDTQNSSDEEEDGEEFQNNHYAFSHCGVSEFISDDGTVLLPQWIMTNLGLQNGDSILLRSVKLENGSFVKLNPLNQNFLKLSNPKAVLETKLRRFACLTPGEIIPIVHNNVKYDIHVVETKPSPGISIIETDCKVEFFQPEPAPVPAPAVAAVCRKVVEARKTEDKATIKFRPFSGTGRRLDGVEVERDEIASVRDGIGKIVLDSKVIRQPESIKEAEDEMKKKKFQAFKGKSRTLLD